MTIRFIRPASEWQLSAAAQLIKADDYAATLSAAEFLNQARQRAATIVTNAEQRRNQEAERGYHEGMAKAKILFEGNEIEAYKSFRYLSTSEAMWRLFGYGMQLRSPNSILLFVHLENEQIAVHDAAYDEQLRRAKANKTCSDLMKYSNRRSGAPFDDLTFLDYFEKFTV